MKLHTILLVLLLPWMIWSPLRAADAKHTFSVRVIAVPRESVPELLDQTDWGNDATGLLKKVEPLLSSRKASTITNASARCSLEGGGAMQGGFFIEFNLRGKPKDPIDLSIAMRPAIPHPDPDVRLLASTQIEIGKQKLLGVMEPSTVSPRDRLWLVFAYLK